MKKRFMSTLLTFYMVLSMLPMTMTPVAAQNDIVIPNWSIKNIITGNTSKLLDDYTGQYRVVFVGDSSCPRTREASSYANAILGRCNPGRVSVFTLDRMRSAVSA